MERREDQRTLSTADLADPNPDEAEARREEEAAAADARETSRLSSRDETDGRYDELSGTTTDQGLDADEDEFAPSPTARSADTADMGTASPLFDTGQTERFQNEWESIQTGFVDEPRRAVEEADRLVADLMQRLAASFAQERSQLEAQWDRGDDVSTEELRLALQRYRSFFGRLLQA